MESVQIGRYFWSLFSCIQSEYKKIRTRNNSVFGHFSRSVPSCICHALYLIFTHDNVINLVIYATYFVGVWFDDWLWPCCYMALFLLEGSVAQKFVVVFIPLNKFLSVIIPMTAGPFSYTGFKLICFSKMSIKVFWYWNHWCWQILEVIVNGCHVIVEIAEFHWVLSCSFCCWSIHIDYCDYVVYQIFCLMRSYFLICRFLVVVHRTFQKSSMHVLNFNFSIF